MNFTREDIKNDTRQIVTEVVGQAVVELATATKQGFDAVDQRFNTIEIDMKELKADVKELKFQMAETVHRPEFLELKQRVEKLERKTA
jgi:hypothetical protein